MTEEEWLRCRDPEPMLRHVGGVASHRKQLLLLVACCRRFSYHPHEDAIHKTLAFAEQYADREVGLGTRKVHRSAVNDVAPNIPGATRAAWVVQRLLRKGTLPSASLLTKLQYARCDAALWLRRGRSHRESQVEATAAFREEQEQQARIVLEVFGNPFRPVAFDPAWRSEATVGIARGIYEDRAFERMPILADALQEAGCENAEVLAHCREPGVHVRGCWVVDLVLGKG